MENQLLFLLDGNSYAYRAYYAIRGLKNSKGFPTNAILGFFNMLNKIIREEKPDYIAVAFDKKAPTFRHKKYKQYKSHRKPMPEDLVTQLPWIKKVLTTLNISIFEEKGYEADDIIATLANRFDNGRLKIYMASNDKDILQLVNHNLMVYKPYSKNNSPLYKKEDIRERYCVPAERITDFLALKGDSSDNIPGVPGIGKKTAAKLINQYGGIEDIYSNLNQISSKFKEKLEHNKDKAMLSRKLTELNMNVPIQTKLDELRFNFENKKNLLPIFKELEFNRLIQKIKTNEL